MACVDATSGTVIVGTCGSAAPVVFVIDSPEHPLPIDSLARMRGVTIASVPVRDWANALTPWPAAGLYREDPAFGGQADATLDELLTQAIPAIEAAHGLVPAARAICGYSLGGLFALYALTHADAFVACACVSGSVWYEGWVEHLSQLPLDLSGRYAFLSLGTKERRAARPLLKTVQVRMETCTDVLRERGCTVDYRTSPGSHLQHVDERLDAGLAALDAFLA
ncbi:MAG: alpha/beta hydrolase-fold protein [Coriobacteriales bacterium]|nr:alpha/beta hydrolase-fold protein [Coriobacteriales bacterium]